ncbi:MAG: MmgE/PrpD family protein [Alcaligenaceae bacterium]
MNATTQTNELTRSFVDLLLAWPANDPVLERQCRLLLLDGLAVAIAGAHEPGPSILAKLAQRDVPIGPARVIGKGFSTGAVQAARINGASMHVLDFEPMWNPPNHALSPLLPALLAVAQWREANGDGVQGKALLRALAKGVEAQGRLRLASGQIEPSKLTMHPPGAVGPLAAALACADLMALPHEQAVAAVSMAASRCGAVLANVGTMTKALHCGDAAANGVEAAMLAAEGFTANVDAIGSPRGWGPALFGATFEPHHLTAALETARALQPGPAWKLFPSQFATHFVITAALELRANNPAVDWGEQVERIELQTPIMHYIDRPKPETGLDGKFSWQYTTAVALLDGLVEPKSFTQERRFSADVVSLLEKINLKRDTTISGRLDQMHVELKVVLRDGRELTQRCDAPLGSWTRPVGSEKIRDKARGLITEVCGSEVATRVDAIVMGTGDFAVKELLALI